MKLLLKLLLNLAVLIAGIYAAAPLWIPGMFAAQLPVGWKVVDMGCGYPGLTSLRCKFLSVVAELPLANLTISADDILVEYSTWKTAVGSVLLDVSTHTPTSENQDRFALDDLALPVLDPGGKLPELSVKELHLSLRHGLSRAVPDPVLLELRSFALVPLVDGAWRFEAGLRPEGAANDVGRLTVNAFTGSFTTEFRFPSNPTLPAWLTLSLDQQTLGSETSTRLEMSLDADNAEQNSLATLFAPGFIAKPPGLSGKMQAQANFAGKQQQVLEQMSATAQGLQVELADADITADLAMSAVLKGSEVVFTLPESGQMRLRDEIGKSGALLERLLPDFEFAQQTGTEEITARVGKDVNITLQLGDDPGLRLTGDVNIEMNSDNRSIVLDARNLDLELAGFTNQDPVQIQGEVGINWLESSPLTIALPGKTLHTQSLSLVSKGPLHLGEQGLEYEQAGTLDLRNPAIELASDGENPPLAVNAESIAADFDVSAQSGGINSNGKALISHPSVNQPSTRSDSVEIAWRDFDLDSMAGQLTTRTTGFSTEIEGQQWSGFELDGSFKLDEDATFRGTASVIIQDGSDLPFSFTGSAATGQWEVALPPTTIKWNRLENTLRAGQFPWPAGVKMTGGEIELHGQLAIAENLTASLESRAFGLGAAILKNTTSDAGFDLDITLSDTLSVSGPISIETVTLAGGVQISDFAADLHLANAETLTLQNLAARVFDGTLQAPSLRFTPDGIEDTEIRLAHIDLARLLAFLDIAGLQGTGDLGFLLPLGSDKAGAHVRGGTFQSAGPGFLSYRKEGMAASNIGLQALENFHYQSLSGTLEYQSKGAYQIGIRLEGENPDLYGGHPIVFRLNINGV
ncbi:MAG: YdbH domain-containing protein, partial [Xanthomonadales bacterium]|nr:YdbH domain-containing protein [Xanthomonadales bacterium]